MFLKRPKIRVKHFSLFMLIFIMLIIFSMILPSTINHFLKLLIYEEKHEKPKGNSVFVMSPRIDAEEDFKKNLQQIFRCFVK